MTRPKIVLDCDPGVDDMFAIFCATRYCDLKAITSVAGNVGIEHTTRNALAITALIGSDTPVHRGAVAPLAVPLVDASHVHGASGLGGTELPEPDRDVASTDAVSALLDETASADVAVVAVGPLTNIALAIQRDPDWAARLPALVLMGGSTSAGNVTPYGEFNIWADPEAADIVFQSGAPITMAGLNLTRQVTMGAPEIEAMRRASTPTGDVASDALEFYAEFSRVNYGVALSAMHDPCAVLQVARPDLFATARMHVAVETNGTHTRGMTVCDQRPNARTNANVDVMTHAERDLVVELIIGAAVDPLQSD